MTVDYERVQHVVNLFKHNPTISVINTPKCATLYVTYNPTYNTKRTEQKYIYCLNCVPKIPYLCSQLCNDKTHTNKYTITNLLHRRNRSAVL